MKPTSIIQRLVILLITLMCALGANAAEAYACYTPSNTTLTFYYDNLRSSRTDVTYDLNTGYNAPDWKTDGTNAVVTKVVFNSSFANARPTTACRWFNGMENLQSITGLIYLNTSEVKNMLQMFSGCRKLTTLDVSHFNTSKVTDMYCMFYSCSSLTSLDLSHFNTSKVTNMREMFSKCYSLTNLDLSNFNTSNVTSMSYMFNECTSLRTIYVGNDWSTAAVTGSNDMFYNCTSLVGGKGTTYNSSNPRDKTYAHIDGGTNNPGYFTRDPNALEAYACYTPSNTTLTFYYDKQRSSRSGTTYDLNEDNNWPGWNSDGTAESVTRVVFYSSFADARPRSTQGWLANMTNLQSVLGIQYLNTSEVTNMFYMFAYCGLPSLNLSYLNTSNVTSMEGMFLNSSFTSLDVSSFNTSNVVDMNEMFAYCYNLTSLDLSNFNTSKVTNMEGMFNESISLESINMSNWNTSNVTDMSYMFNECNALSSIDVSHFNTSNVTDMQSMFNYCTSLTSLDLRNFDTSKVTNMEGMFNNCRALESLNVSNWNTSNVTNMGYMFANCSRLTRLDLGGFNTFKVTLMWNMFSGCSQLVTIYAGSGWSTAAVTDFYSDKMFLNCTSLLGGQGTTYDASHIDKTYAHIDGGTSNPGYFTLASEAYACYTPSNTTLTFYYDTQRSSRSGTIYDLNVGKNEPDWYTDGTNKNVSKVVFKSSFANARPTTTYYWFYNMENLKSITAMSYLNTSEVTNMVRMFGSCSKLTSLDLRNFNTAKVTDMQGMFRFCNRLTSLDLSNFNTSKVTNMRNMFYNCIALTSLDVSSFNTSQVTNMYSMFAECSSLTSLDVSSFNTSKVTDMAWLFAECANLRTIYVGEGWSTEVVNDYLNMFRNSTSLLGGQGTTYDASHIDKAYAHIDGGTSNPGYFTDANGPRHYACYTPSNTTLTFYYDNLHGSRTGTTYFLNDGVAEPGWESDRINANVTKVVFNSSFANARPTTTYYWFYNMENLQSITGMSYLNTSEVSNMAYMFSGCKNLSSIDLSHFNTAKVTDMNTMFGDCSNLINLDLGSFNTTRVTDMSMMFYNCSGLTSLDLSSFNTSKVIHMYGMFYFSSNLRTIYVGNGWSTAAVTSSLIMFTDCTSLVGGKGTTFDYNHADKTYAHIDGGTSNPGYFTARNVGIATDLHQVTSDKQQVQSDEWYTIDGRKLNGMPAKKGVYIQNGKKTIVH